MALPRRLTLLTMGVAVLHGLLVVASTSHRIFFGTVGARDMFDDVGIYFRYASKVTAGEVPYRDFLVEYPLFALPLFVLPRLFASSFAAYKVAFGLEMLLANAVTVFLVARQVERDEGPDRVPARLAWYTAYFGCLCPLLICRFDLAVTALTFGAACAWFSGRAGLGGALAGLGTLVKVMPGVIAAPALVWEVGHRRERRGRGMAAFGLTLVVGLAFWVLVGGRGVAKSFGYHLERGIEIGSLYAGALALAAKATGSALSNDYRHSSVEVMTPWSSSAAALAFPLQAAALALVMWRFWRSGGVEPLRYAAAAVLGFVTFGKVLSPQYLVWLLPFVTVVRGPIGPRVRGLFLLACLTTTTVYPLGWGPLCAFVDWAVLLLNYRNLMLLWVWLLLVFGPDAAPAPSDA